MHGQLSTSISKFLLLEPGDTSVVDSGFVVNGSLTIQGYESPNDFLQVHNKVVWYTKTRPDSVLVSYKKLQFAVTYKRKDQGIIYNSYEQNPFRYEPNKAGELIDYGTLNSAGNVSRGIGFGNAQDVVVNSNLNLRINGTVANDVEVLAVISDENNPIQPEGNTQQIQDFDQVYITLKKDSTTLTLGDFLMQRPADSYFINYYKKSRGIQVQNVTHSHDWRITTEAEAALSRGRFNRNRIDGIEGNSGPYRLSGENGELFIVVIAGTENVFLDGRALTRGENNDYVVNYNTGEITFTPRILITRYSRIVVEFQYSDRNYGRAVAHLGSSATKNGFTIYANAFNEMDLKSQPFQVDLEVFDSLQNKSAKKLLAEAGDGVAVISKVKPQLAFNTDRIMYIKSVAGGTDIFIYAQDATADETFYEVFFSNVGLRKGSYVQSQTAANGKVFEYVGEKMGDYDPIEILIAPQSLKAINVGLKFATKNRVSGIEYSRSNRDKNTLSALDDRDNDGFGLRLFRTASKQLKDSNWTWNTDVNYEMVSGQYRYVERYRAVEFDRKWNKQLTNPTAIAQLLPAYEHIGNVSFGLRKSAQQYIKNNSSLFFRPDNFVGFSNLTDGRFTWQKIQLNTSLELTQSGTNEGDTANLKNKFYSLSSQISRPLGKVNAGVGYVNERSIFQLDTLLRQSYAFKNYSVFLSSIDSALLKYTILANQRTDNLPKNDQFLLSTVGSDVSLNTQYTTSRNQRIALSSTYRKLEIKDVSLSDKPIENSLQSRLEMDFHFLKKFIRTRTFYQVGTGQEQRREFQFLQVQAGNGVYVWIDYDSNNLKTLNEFEIASDLDRQRADYIKIFTPVPGFFTTNSNKISQTLEFTPAVFFKSGVQKKPFIARFNNISTLILDKKILPNTILGFLNPAERSLTDTGLINSAISFRTTLFYNRGNPKYSFDYTYMNASSKTLLSNGFDSRSAWDNVLNARINLGRMFTLDTRMVLGDKLYLSEFFGARSYHYGFYEIEPKLQMLINNTYRIELKTKYFNAANLAEYGGESSRNIEVGSEVKYTKSTKGAVNAAVSYIKVKYDGVAGSTLGYELLRGLQNGNNATWKMGYQRTMSNNIQVIISYDGRKSESSPVIHIGRLVARYLF